jgi:hypothetical protein
MARPDPWEKAAECERALQAANDPRRRALLENLRNQWIALANRRSLMTDVKAARDADVSKRGPPERSEPVRRRPALTVTLVLESAEQIE